jgi:pimeloyl-ACP methyl ester carboxylesterase
VITIHGALIAEAFAPLLAQPVLSERYQVVLYHRRGYGRSTHPQPPLPRTEHVTDCVDLMTALGIARAHIVGHSGGGWMAVELALQAPERVGTLALLEPALQLESQSDESPVARVFQAAMPRYQAGDNAGAVDAFLQFALGEGYREWLDRMVPGAFDQAVADADSQFIPFAPMPSYFRRADAERIDQPVLVVRGAETPGADQLYDCLLDWLPRGEGFVLPGANHALQMMNPHGLATALAEFFGRNPLTQTYN